MWSRCHGRLAAGPAFHLNTSMHQRPFFQMCSKKWCDTKVKVSKVAFNLCTMQNGQKIPGQREVPIYWHEPDVLDQA